MKAIYATMLAGVLFAATPALSHGAEEHAPVAQHDAVAAGEKVTALVAKIDSGVGALEQEIAEKAFDKIHQSTEEVLSALQGITAVSTGKAGVADTVKQLETVLDALHEAGDAKDAPAAERHLHKFSGGLKLLKLQL